MLGMKKAFQTLRKKMIAIGDLPGSTQNGLKSNKANYGYRSGLSL